MGIAEASTAPRFVAWQMVALCLIVLALPAACGRGVTSPSEARETPSVVRPVDGAVRILFADTTDLRVADVVASLEAAGYTTVGSAGKLRALVGPATRSVVLTRSAWEQMPKEVFRSLYERGVVIAALDVAVAEVADILPVGTGNWLPYLPDQPIFSVVFQCRGNRGATSDLLLDARRLDSRIRYGEDVVANGADRPPQSC